MSGALGRLGLKLLDGVQYAVLLLAAAVVVVGGASLLVTGNLVALKWVLFLVGLLSGAMGSLKLRPKPAWKDEQRAALRNGYADGGYGGLVSELPPVAWLDYDQYDHLSDGGRMLLLGVLAWATSFALEVIGGVGVPQVPGAA